MILETERLILRPWRFSDAVELYHYAKDSQVGLMCGWHPHTCLDYSVEIIRNILSVPDTYAITIKALGDKAVGSISIMRGKSGTAKMKDDEAEIGCWIGVPFWGQGLVAEAVRELQRQCFEELKCSVIWCGYYDGNERSKRLQEKCGFHYHHTVKDVSTPMGEHRTEHFTCMTKEEWLNIKSTSK